MAWQTSDGGGMGMGGVVQWRTAEELKGIKPEPVPRPADLMRPVVMLPTYTGDEHLAINLLKWIAELGKVNTKCYVICSASCRINELLAAAREAFTSAAHILDGENIKSDWAGGGGNATATNGMFRLAAWNQYLPTPREPWLWLEADAVPLVPEWFERLAAEYRACNKCFMGDLISSNSNHMSGVAFYDPRLPEIVPEMIHPNLSGVAFDVAKPDRVLEMAHITKQIQDVWRHEVEEIRPEAVLFHCAKDGKLIEELRRRKNGGDATCIANTASYGTFVPPAETRLVPAIVSSGAVKFDPSSAPVMSPQGSEQFLKELVEMQYGGKQFATVDIVIKSYPADYAMLNIALESIEKYAKGVRRIVVISPDDFRLHSSWFMKSYRDQALIIPIHWEDRSAEKEPGYLWQQRCKLYADEHTDADYLWFHDSDCVFTRPVDVSELFLNGKPYWLKTPFDQNQARPDQQVWKPIMEKFVGREARHELMRRHNFLVHRDWLAKLREFCLYRHGKKLSDYIMDQAVPNSPLSLTFSEWNCLGHFLHEFHPDLVSWVDTTKDAVPREYIYQSYTHCSDQEKASHRSEMRLAASLDVAAMVSPVVLKQEPRPELPESITADPMLQWSLDSAFNLLSSEARKSPLHKARLVAKFKRTMAGVKVEKTSMARAILKGSYDGPCPVNPKVLEPSKKRGRPPKKKAA